VTAAPAKSPARVLRARVAPCTDPKCPFEGDLAVTCPAHPGDVKHVLTREDAFNQGRIHIQRQHPKGASQ
jgi:hypothetical protein